MAWRPSEVCCSIVVPSLLSTAVYPAMVWLVVVLVFTAFNIVDRLTARFEAFVDDNSRYYYAFVVSAR
jgi:hypothetical protein